MNDDEVFIQSVGLGIVGNLILLPQSFPLLFDNIPNFVDMALSLVMHPFERLEKRTEALMLINNFVVSFCQEASVEVKSEIINIFENCGFFEHLSENLSRSAESFLALSELILNLTLIDEEFIRKQALNGHVVQNLILVDHAPSFNSESMKRIYDRQTDHTNSESFLMGQKNAFKIFLLLQYDSDAVRTLLCESASLMPYIAKNVSMNILASSKNWYDPSLCLNTFWLLGDIIEYISMDKLKVLISSVGRNILSLLCVTLGLRKESIDISLHLLSRLLHLEFEDE
jgi:hypothetical protein